MIYSKITKLIDIFSEEYVSGEWITDKQNDGTPEHPFQMPYVAYNREVADFLKAVYDDNLMDKEYNKHIEENGIDLSKQLIKDIDISNMGAKMVLTLLTYIIRSDRFCEGALKSAIESGTITKLLKRLRELDSDS